MSENFSRPASMPGSSGFARGGHRVEILPRLWSCYDQGIAGGMYLHDILYLAATRAGDGQLAAAAH